MGSISPNVVIMTDAELQTIKQAEYARGVQRGRFEEKHDRVIASHDNPRHEISVSEWELLTTLTNLIRRIDRHAFAHHDHCTPLDFLAIRDLLNGSPEVAALRTIAEKTKEPAT